MNRRRSQKRAAHGSLRFESLEARIVLEGRLLWTDTSQMTVSFSPDGTDIAGEPSTLHRMLNRQFSDRPWQNTILRAFQAWAHPTSANIGLVAEHTIPGLVPIDDDSPDPIDRIEPIAATDGTETDAEAQEGRVGYPFGTPGPRTEDPRFGDIRIGARPLSSELFAVAISHDTITSGTWSGDVIFNSSVKFQSLGELAAVALHEAGHVFGLGHNEDDESVMREHGPSRVRQPSARDIDEARQRHGVRVPDQYENPARVGNGTIETATPISIPETANFTRGRVPAVVYADLHVGHDVDVFRLPAFADYGGGGIEVRLQTAGISLLAPEITVFSIDAGDGEPGDEEGDGVDRVTTHGHRRFTGLRGTSISLRISDYDPADDYYIRINAGRQVEDLFSVGTYSLMVSYENRIAVDDGLIDEILNQRIRYLAQDELQQQFEENGSIRVDVGIGEPVAALDIVEKPGFEAFDYYEAVGSIETRTEVDVYRVQTPFIDTAIYMQSNVHSLRYGRLIPEIKIVDIHKNVIPSQVLVNGNGEYVIQTELRQQQEYFVLVHSAQTYTDFYSNAYHHGNYRVGVYFTNEAVQMDEIASGKVGDEVQSGHSLFVGRSHLFHFALQAQGTNEDFSRSANQAVAAYFINEEEQLVHQLVARVGTTRTSHSVLLPAGAYTVQVFPIAYPGELTFIQQFGIFSTQVSEEYSLFDDDSTEDPFECPNGEGPYCYPGGIVSENPYLWDDFLGSLPEIPDLDPEELISTLFGDWWRWFWKQTGENGPPRSVADENETTPGQSLMESAEAGVLHNDFDPEDDPLTAILKTDVSFGLLSLAIDGGYTYTPDPGFIGTDRFQYAAYDFNRESNPSWVKILVRSDTGVPGDLSGDGVTDATDIDMLAAGIRGTQDEIFDLDADNEVSFDDLEYLVIRVLDTTFGDTNLDGRFNSGDLIPVFQAGEYEDGISKNSRWESGDWDGDGDFASGDLIAAFQYGGYTNSATAYFDNSWNAAIVDLVWDEDKQLDARDSARR